jgi:hypothetical protein
MYFPAKIMEARSTGGNEDGKEIKYYRCCQGIDIHMMSGTILSMRRI